MGPTCHLSIVTWMDLQKCLYMCSRLYLRRGHRVGHCTLPPYMEGHSMGSIFYHQSGYFQIDSKVALDLDNSMYLAKLWILSHNFCHFLWRYKSSLNFPTILYHITYLTCRDLITYQIITSTYPVSTTKN